MPISPTKLATLPTVDQRNADFMMQNPQYSYTIPPKAPTTQSVQQGYWTEGKIDPKTNIVGTGTFVPTVMETGTKLDKTRAELDQKGNAIAQQVTGNTINANNANNTNTPAEFNSTDYLNQAIRGAEDAGMFKESPEAKALRDMMRQNLDAQTQASLSAIQQQFAQQEALMVESQQASSKGLENVLNLGGGARYAPISSMGLVQAKNKYDMQTLQELHAKEESAKAAVLQAQREGNYKLMEQQMNSLESLRKEKLAWAGKIADDMAAQNKEIRDRKYDAEKELQKNISSITVEAGKSGAPPEVIDEVGKAKTLSEAVKAAGDYLQSGGSGIVAEYNFYKKDAANRGLIPLSFDEYQTRDANRKVSIAKAGVAVAGTNLDTKQQAVFNGIVTKYNASPAIQALDRANQLKNILLDAEKNPKDAGSQLNLLYAYIKGLDTDSAVREGELDLVKGISNYFSKYEMYFTRLAKNQAVPSSVITDMITGGKKLVSSIEDTANRKKKVFDAQAKANGTQVYDAWKGFDESISGMGSLSDELVSTSEEAKKAVDDFILANPDRANEVASLAENKYTDEQILEYLNMNK